MYWNVENFSINKIDSTVAPEQGDVADDGTQGTSRLDFLLDTLQPANGAIDLFVLVELKPGSQDNAAGNLVNDLAKRAARQLLAQIRGNLANTWCLVPPVVSGADGRREAVAVYYNSANLRFLGPENGKVYSQRWRDGLPNRNVPNGYPINANVSERTLGGKIVFNSRHANLLGNIPGNVLNFPNAGFRTPFLTYFGVVGNPNRLIKVLAYHSSPNQRNARTADQGTAELANIWEMSDQPVIGGGGVTEVNVIVGDFNVDASDGNFINNGPFADLVAGMGAAHPLAAPYTPLLRIPALFPQDDLTYFSTHFKQLKSSHIENGADPLGRYPGYGYMDLIQGSLDNAFVRVRNGGAAASNITIFNRVTGTPYNPTHPNAPAGHYQSVTAMGTDLDTMFNDLANDPDDYSADEFFWDWGNYGTIRSTSDHVPLIFDV
jgi:hypothetical protein